MSINIEDNKKLLEDSLNGKRGEDQTLIARMGLDFITTLLRKNIDYGSSVFETPILSPELEPKVAIEVRLSDKIKRFEQLKKAEANVKSESIEDTMKDFGAYGLLWLVANEKEKIGVEEPNPTPETKLDIDKYLGQPLTYFPHGKALFTLDNTKILLSEIDHNKYIYQTTTKPGIVILSKISD